MRGGLTPNRDHRTGQDQGAGEEDLKTRPGQRYELYANDEGGGRGGSGGQTGPL